MNDLTQVDTTDATATALVPAAVNPATVFGDAARGTEAGVEACPRHVGRQSAGRGRRAARGIDADDRIAGRDAHDGARLSWCQAPQRLLEIGPQGGRRDAADEPTVPCAAGCGAGQCA